MAKHSPTRQYNGGTVRDQLLSKLGPVKYGQLIKSCKSLTPAGSLDAAQTL